MRQTQDRRHRKHTNVPLQRNMYRNLRNIFWSPYTRNRAVRVCCILPSKSFPYSRKGSSKGLRFPRILATALVSDFPKRRISLACWGFPRILATVLFKGTPVLNFRQDSFLRILATTLLWILTIYGFYLHVTGTFLIFFRGCSPQDEVWIYSCTVIISFRDKQRDWQTNTVNYIYGFCTHIREPISVT